MPVNEDEKDETNKDLVELKKNKDDGFEPKNTSQPYAIVVLGGGLTLAENGKDIVVNNYTRLRLEKTLSVEKNITRRLC